MYKVCFKCEIEKPLSEFYKHKQMTDGHLNKCKECAKADVIKNRNDNIDYYTEYEKKRANLPHRVKARKEYSKTDEGTNAAIRSKTKYIEENPIKRAAHILVGNAVRDGRLIKGDCESCGTNKDIHGHHCDYAKPLEVMWLCAQCHRDWHKENEAINGDMPEED